MMQTSCNVIVAEKEEVVRRFRRKEVRQVVKVVLENPWILEEANDIRESYYITRALVAKKGYKDAYEWLRTAEAVISSNYFPDYRGT